jgi:hypothetical protein
MPFTTFCPRCFHSYKSKNKVTVKTTSRSPKQEEAINELNELFNLKGLKVATGTGGRIRVSTGERIRLERLERVARLRDIFSRGK